ncbi:MAG: peptidoglycan-binding protein [Proteobacteria bacterium]|nr:peptidoglycan-binding protein [Pseudomonadota bacterium]
MLAPGQDQCRLGGGERVGETRRFDPVGDRHQLAGDAELLRQDRDIAGDEIAEENHTHRVSLSVAGTVFSTLSHGGKRPPIGGRGPCPAVPVPGTQGGTRVDWAPCVRHGIRDRPRTLTPSLSRPGRVGEGVILASVRSSRPRPQSPPPAGEGARRPLARNAGEGGARASAREGEGPHDCGGEGRGWGSLVRFVQSLSPRVPWRQSREKPMIVSRRFALLLMLAGLAAPASALAQDLPACTTERAGERLCRAGNVCVCRVTGGSLLGIPQALRWDCQIGNGACIEGQYQSMSRFPGSGVQPPQLARSRPPAARPESGLERADIVLLQKALAKNGFDPGPADGVLGPRTRAALNLYQRRERLPVTDRPTAEVMARLKG